MALKLVKIKGSKNYYVRGTVCGRTVYESTGLDSERLADAYRVNLESQIQDAHAFGKKDSILFSEAAAMYVRSGGSARYLKPIAEAFAETPVENLRQPDLDAYALKRFPDQANATRDRIVYTPFIAVMNYAAENEYCQYRKWRRPKKQDKVRKNRVATVEEVAAMYDHAPLHIRPLIVLMAYAGLRPGEAVRLQWEDVDLEKRWLVVWKSKTGKPRGVPLHRAVIRELSALPHREGAVIRKYSKNPKAYDYLAKGGSTAKRARQKAAERAGIGSITWYDFRHTCATWLMMAGISREMRQDMLGHSRKAVHDTYVHVPSAALVEAIERLPDFTDFSRKS
jgi:integrase/recombinase XerD